MKDYVFLIKVNTDNKSKEEVVSETLDKLKKFI
jgi:hypothetical protein